MGLYCRDWAWGMGDWAWGTQNSFLIPPSLIPQNFSSQLKTQNFFSSKLPLSPSLPMPIPLGWGSFTPCPMPHAPTSLLHRRDDE
ncbi:MAG: hypothetical protein KME19_03555 [Microcoleus vaginatus WJT46-NPBG5]|nr:hypothetical protein [Microcoleus vaginatus WJT46-NPBG5]